MQALGAYLRRWRDRSHVRPWALAVPVLVLVACAPLLRPLRFPDPRDASDEEVALLLTVEAMVERRTAAIAPPPAWTMRNVVRVGDSVYSAQPPVSAALLAGPYWLMARNGLTFERNPIVVPYLLTLLGATLPVAGAAGIVYRAARLFELRRPWRMVLAVGAVFGTGLVSYATVLNPHAPAAALLLAAIACLIHIYTSTKRHTAAVWLVLGGLCAALAATIDPGAMVFPALIPCAILAFPWSLATRLGGVLLYAIGAAPPLLLHVVLATATTGSVIPEMFPMHLGINTPDLTSPDANSPADNEIWLDDPDASPWLAVGRHVGRAFAIVVGDHGVLSHFPVLVMGVIGTFMVMHRNWPPATKVLAAASVGGTVVVVLAYATSTPDSRDAMFGVRWFIAAQPLVLFWAGAWLRRSHRPLSWAVAGIALGFSTIVTLVGATGPMPPGGFAGYAAADAVDRLIFPRGRDVTDRPSTLVRDGARQRDG